MNTSLSSRYVTSVTTYDPTGAVLLALAAIVTILGRYHQTTWSIISIWERSETFAHGFFIFPISAYLIWRQRKSLIAIQPQADLRALLVLGILGFGWLLGSLANVQVFQQYCLVAMIPAAVWAILGSRFAWAIAFPLSYLLLAVPFGEVFIPPMVDLTADFTVHALQITGIPVFREGSFFTIPSGSWSVVEACSGLRYLIASFTLGTLYAYISFDSIKRRLVFIAFSILVPIIANGMRAYMIVMIGHLSGMRLAVGVDHLIYGWLFFGLVMLLLFWIGSFWREQVDVKKIPASALTANAVGKIPLTSIIMATCACIGLGLIWPMYANYLENRFTPGENIHIKIPGVPGKWDAVAGNQALQWRPHYVGAPVQFQQRYQNAGHAVSLHIAYYRNQQRGAELITSGNSLLPEDAQQWHNISEETRKISFAQRQLRIRQNLLLTPSGKLL
ncbi:MAG: exosortase A, partial [Oxalobacteraceae bacterium]